MKKTFLKIDLGAEMQERFGAQRVAAMPASPPVKELVDAARLTLNLVR